MSSAQLRGSQRCSNSNLPARGTCFSIKPIVLLVQCNCRFVRFLLRTWFCGGGYPNKHFALTICHMEKIGQSFEPGLDRQGCESGGHVGDVICDIERITRQSPVRRIVGSSRRSGGCALFNPPISAFRCSES